MFQTFVDIHCTGGKGWSTNSLTVQVALLKYIIARSMKEGTLWCQCQEGQGACQESKRNSWLSLRNPKSSITIYHHHLSSSNIIIIIHITSSSSIIIHHHNISSSSIIIIHHHPSWSIMMIHHHASPSSSIIIITIIIINHHPSS